MILFSSGNSQLFGQAVTKLSDLLIVRERMKILYDLPDIGNEEVHNER